MQETISTTLDTTAISNTPKTIADFAAQEVKILYTLHSVFPFDTFPTTISIQASTISIVQSLFTISKRIVTIKMEDIFTVEVATGIFFATLKIQQKQPMIPVVELTYFWKDEALRARRVIQGLLVVQTKNLEIKNMKPAELLQYLEEIGSSQTGL